MAYYLACHPTIAGNFPDVVHRSAVIASHTVTQLGTQSSFVTDALPNWLFTAIDNTELTDNHTTHDFK